MPSSYTIRVATPEDIPAIDALLARSYPQLLAADYPPSILVTAIPLIAKAQAQLVTSGTYYVAEDDAGQVLGAGGWTKAPPQGKRRRGVGNIRHFGTDPDATRRGVAGALMARCLQDASAAGLGALDCLSTRTAVPFYAAQGFAEVGPVEITLRPGIVFPAIAMTRRL